MRARREPFTPDQLLALLSACGLAAQFDPTDTQDGWSLAGPEYVTATTNGARTDSEATIEDSGATFVVVLCWNGDVVAFVERDKRGYVIRSGANASIDDERSDWPVIEWDERADRIARVLLGLVGSTVVRRRPASRRWFELRPTKSGGFLRVQKPNVRAVGVLELAPVGEVAPQTIEPELSEVA